MLAVMHYNGNIEAENKIDKDVSKKNLNTSRAVREHNSKIQKTQLYKWQQTIMEYISLKPDRNIINSDDIKCLSDESIQLDTAPNEPEANEIELEESFNFEWLNNLEND